MSWDERAAERSPDVERSRSRGRKQARAIAAAAERLLATRGGAFTTQDVTKEAGISLQTFYRYFASKDHLLLAVFEDIIDRAVERYELAASSGADPLEQLRNGITASLDAQDDGPAPSHRFITAEYWRLYELFPEEMVQATQPLLDSTERLLRAAADAGQLKSDDPAQDAWLISKMVMAVFHHRAFAPMDARAMLAKEQLWSFILAALGTERPVAGDLPVKAPDAEAWLSTDVHGVQVLHRRWPHAAPSAVVVLSHGASEHSGRYARFATALQQAGFAAYALDHRGHGQTALSTGRGRMGPPDGSALVDDLDELVDVASMDHPGVPLVLFGHSMGSLIALAYATRHSSRLAGLVLCGFPADIDDVAGTVQLFQQAIEAGMADQPIDSLSGLNTPFEPARTPFDWLSRDEVEVDRYVADPLCGDDLPLTYGFVIELFGLVAPAVRPDGLGQVSCPVLLVTGGEDVAAGMGAHAATLEAAMRGAGVAVESRLYAGARHELLNEINREQVTADIAAWVARTTNRKR